jgi:hypothetical protein
MTDVLAKALAGMVTADGAATWWWLHTGAAIEGNPLVAWLIDLHGLTTGLAIRTVAALLLVAALAYATNQTKWAERGLIVCALAYAAVLGIHLDGAIQHT